MALAGEGDVGEAAVDPQSESDRRPIRFTDNGEVDTWPVESTVSYDQIEAVVKAWAAQQSRWQGVHWTDEPSNLVDPG